MIAVFADWSTAHSKAINWSEDDTFHGMETQLANEDDNNTKNYIASKDLLRAEARARSSMRASISFLYEILDEDLKRHELRDEICISSIGKITYTSQGSNALSIPLSNRCMIEQVELRGFLPLIDIYEVNKSRLEL